MLLCCCLVVVCLLRRKKKAAPEKAPEKAAEEPTPADATPAASDEVKVEEKEPHEPVEPQSTQSPAPALEPIFKEGDGATDTTDQVPEPVARQSDVAAVGPRDASSTQSGWCCAPACFSPRGEELQVPPPSDGGPDGVVP